MSASRSIRRPPTARCCAAPSWQYPLGTDNFGRSVLALMIAGARISLLVGLTAAMGAMHIGAVVGIASGYFGGTGSTRC